VESNMLRHGLNAIPRQVRYLSIARDFVRRRRKEIGIMPKQRCPECGRKMYKYHLYSLLSRIRLKKCRNTFQWRCRPCGVIIEVIDGKIRELW